MDVPQNRTHFLAEFPPDIHILREMSMCKKIAIRDFLESYPGTNRYPSHQLVDRFPMVSLLWAIIIYHNHPRNERYLSMTSPQLSQFNPKNTIINSNFITNCRTVGCLSIYLDGITYHELLSLAQFGAFLVQETSIFHKRDINTQKPYILPPILYFYGGFLKWGQP